MFFKQSLIEKAWTNGQFEATRKLALKRLAKKPADNLALRYLALAASALGDFEGAIAAGEKLQATRGRDPHLEDALLWSYFHQRDIVGAARFAHDRKFTKSAAIAHQLHLAEHHPFDVQVTSRFSLSFTDDPLTSFLPGVPVCLNGDKTIARIDTGGSFIHIAQSQARQFDIVYSGGEKSFAALSMHKIWHGVADLSIGDAVLKNTPVVVHDDKAFPTAGIADAFGVELGPIIGTNILRLFRATFDYPRRRIDLAPRRCSADDHDQTDREIIEAPFAILGSHFMVAEGVFGDRRTLYFLDTGLAAFTEEQGQAGMLIAERHRKSLGISKPKHNEFAITPSPVGLAPAATMPLAAAIVSNAMWRGFGDWQGVKIDALLSHAYFKTFIWTLDFARQVIVLEKAA